MTLRDLYFPIVKNKRSPTSPRPGFNMPLFVNSLSTPASQISTPSGHSSAARRTPTSAPTTLSTNTFCAPHSLNVWIAAAQVPPVAMTGSRMMARLDAEPWWFGRLL